MRSAKPERVVVINDHAVVQGIALISAKLIRARGAPVVSSLSGAAPAAPALGKRGVSVSILRGRHLLDRSAGSAVTRGTARCLDHDLGYRSRVRSSHCSAATEKRRHYGRAQPDAVVQNGPMLETDGFAPIGVSVPRWGTAPW